jgi:hypothetical protein
METAPSAFRHSLRWPDRGSACMACKTARDGSALVRGIGESLPVRTSITSVRGRLSWHRPLLTFCSRNTRHRAS